MNDNTKVEQQIRAGCMQITEVFTFFTDWGIKMKLCFF